MADKVDTAANMNIITICFGDRYRCIARPANYTGLQKEGRKAFPMMGSVASLVVLFSDPALPGRWVELAPDAYPSVPNGAVLHFNVQHTITKEYILPLPGQEPDLLPKPQIPENAALAAEGVKVSRRHLHIPRPPPPPTYTQTPTATTTTTPGAFAVRPGGDVCGSGWGVASERLRRSARLVPNLRDCREAVGLADGASNGYPDEQTADDDEGVKRAGQGQAQAQGHMQQQHQHYDACVPRCSHDCDCQLCQQQRAGARPSPAFTTVLPSLGGGPPGGGSRGFVCGPTPAPGSSASNWHPRGGWTPQPQQEARWTEAHQSVPYGAAGLGAAMAGGGNHPGASREAARKSNADSPSRDAGGIPGQPIPSTVTSEAQASQGQHASNNGTGYIQSPLTAESLQQLPVYQGYANNQGVPTGYQGYQQPAAFMPGAGLWSPVQLPQQYGYENQYPHGSLIMDPIAVRSSSPTALSSHPSPSPPPPPAPHSSPHLNPARFKTGSPRKSRAKARDSSAEWAASRNVAHGRRGRTTANDWDAPKQQGMGNWLHHQQLFGLAGVPPYGGAFDLAYLHQAALAAEFDARRPFQYGDVDPNAGAYNTSASARKDTASEPDCADDSDAGSDAGEDASKKRGRAGSADFWYAPPTAPRSRPNKATTTAAAPAADKKIKKKAAVRGTGAAAAAAGGGGVAAVRDAKKKADRSRGNQNGGDDRADDKQKRVTRKKTKGKQGDEGPEHLTEDQKEGAREWW